MTPFISVIVPVYNTEKLVGRCLRSIVGQSFEEIEVLVIDDGSTDGTSAVIGQFAAADPRVRCFSTANSGVSAARNLGLDNAEGEYVLFIDADDEIEEGYLKSIADNAKASKADLLIWGIKRCLKDGRVEEMTPQLRGDYDRKSFLLAFPEDHYGKHQGLYGFVPNKLVRRSLVEAYGLRFDESMILMEDFVFFLDCYANARSFFCFPETGYRYYIFENPNGSIRYSDSMYRQLIDAHSKCAGLLDSEGLLTEENERFLSEAIGGLSMALFLEMRAPRYSKVKSGMDFLWDNPYCIPALSKKQTNKVRLKRLILGRNVPLTFLYVITWRVYLSFRTKSLA